jgi:hypothetical protein
VVFKVAFKISFRIKEENNLEIKIKPIPQFLSLLQPNPPEALFFSLWPNPMLARTPSRHPPPFLVVDFSSEHAKSMSSVAHVILHRAILLQPLPPPLFKSPCEHRTLAYTLFLIPRAAAPFFPPPFSSVSIKASSDHTTLPWHCRCRRPLAEPKAREDAPRRPLRPSARNRSKASRIKHTIADSLLRPSWTGVNSGHLRPSPPSPTARTRSA